MTFVDTYPWGRGTKDIVVDHHQFYPYTSSPVVKGKMTDDHERKLVSLLLEHYRRLEREVEDCLSLNTDDEEVHILLHEIDGIRKSMRALGYNDILGEDAEQSSS